MVFLSLMDSASVKNILVLACPAAHVKGLLNSAEVVEIKSSIANET